MNSQLKKIKLTKGKEDLSNPQANALRHIKLVLYEDLV